MFLSTSGSDDGRTGDERRRRGLSKLVQAADAPRRLAAASRVCAATACTATDLFTLSLVIGAARDPIVGCLS